MTTVVSAPEIQDTNNTGILVEASTSLPALRQRLEEEQARAPLLVEQLNASSSRAQLLQQQIQQQQDIIAGLDSPLRRAPPGLTALAGSGSVGVQRARAVARLQILTDQLTVEDSTRAGIEAELQDIQELQDLIAELETAPPVSPASPTQVIQSPNIGSDAAAIAGDFEFAASQAAVSDQRRQACDGDWRVKLRLAGSADYLYKSNDPGILAPLRDSDGVIFPYTPQITTNYATNYSTYDLTHSNYRGYFYQNSYVSEITVDATFTAQDTFEANYLLAVIHFFRSATKMFYGQENNQYRGSPPPLVFLQGLGEFQFNLAPCLVQNFNYVLPSDVDYIRANAADELSSLRRDSGVSASQQGLFTPSAALRLTGARIPAGGIPPRGRVVSTGGPCNITYVPTKMQISLTLYPVQTRSQVSREFSFSDYANGRLIKRGFW